MMACQMFIIRTYCAKHEQIFHTSNISKIYRTQQPFFVRFSNIFSNPSSAGLIHFF
jgi:hypothetical protein